MDDTEAVKAAELATRDKTLSAYCPVCGANPDERCRNTVTGQPGNIVHAGRVLAWERIRRG